MVLAPLARGATARGREGLLVFAAGVRCVLPNMSENVGRACFALLVDAFWRSLRWSQAEKLVDFRNIVLNYVEQQIEFQRKVRADPHLLPLRLHLRGRSGS